MLYRVNFEDVSINCAQPRFQHKNTKNFKLVSVVCKKIQLKSKNKTFRLFEKGFDDNTLCYINNLQGKTYSKCVYNIQKLIGTLFQLDGSRSFQLVLTLSYFEWLLVEMKTKPEIKCWF